MRSQPRMTEWIQKLNWIGNDSIYIYYSIYGVLCFIFDSNFLWYCFVDFLCRLVFCSYYCMLINQSVPFLLDTQHWINIVIKLIKSFNASSQTIGIEKVEKTQNCFIYSTIGERPTDVIPIRVLITKLSGQ